MPVGQKYFISKKKKLYTLINYYVTKTNGNIIKLNKYTKQLLINIFNEKNGRSCFQLAALSRGYGLW
jgi:hypothetical protein